MLAVCDYGVMSDSVERDSNPTSDDARARMLRALRGVDLDPQQTTDDVVAPAESGNRDQEMKDDVPPHHGS